MSDSDLQIQLCIADTLFHLDTSTIVGLRSDFLTRLVDKETNFQKPEDGVYKVPDADPVAFSAFVDLFCSSPGYGVARFEALQKENEELMETEADFWGIKDHVSGTLMTVNVAAKVIQRLMMGQSVCTFDPRHRIHCGVCGVRWGYRSNTCELITCPWKHTAGQMKIPEYLRSSIFVCRPCGQNRRPDLAESSFYCPCERETFGACHWCAGTCNGDCRRWF